MQGSGVQIMTIFHARGRAAEKNFTHGGPASQPGGQPGMPGCLSQPCWPDVPAVQAPQTSWLAPPAASGLASLAGKSGQPDPAGSLWVLGLPRDDPCPPQRFTGGLKVTRTRLTPGTPGDRHRPEGSFPRDPKGAANISKHPQ